MTNKMSQMTEINRQNEMQHLFKLVLIGDSGVGKSCLLLRFSQNYFTDSFITTIGVDFHFRTLNINGKSARLQVWDTAGQERFKTITSAYYRGANGVMIVYDTTDRDSFNRVEEWNNEINKYASVNVKMLLGNKCDLQKERVVSSEEGKKKADELGIYYMELSAKTAENVEEAFFWMTSLLLDTEQSSRKEYTFRKPFRIFPDPDLEPGGSHSVWWRSLLRYCGS